MITSHGPRGLTDNQPANHYSTLATIQDAFGLGCLRFTCDTKHVTPLTALVAITGSKAIATSIRPQLHWPTPTPSQPKEPTGESPKSPKPSGGWSVQRTQTLGTSDNSLGPVAGSSPTDVWAVGDYLPDQNNSNQDATLSFAEHWNGKSWTVVRTPNAGPNFNSFYGLAAKDGRAWAVGEHLNSAYQDRLLVEVWNGRKWSIANTPNPGSVRDMGFGASALSPDNVWVVGDQEGPDNIFETLAEHWNGHTWSVYRIPDPGPDGNHLYAVDAVSSGDVWAAGQQLGPTVPDQGLVEHWNGHRWSVVPLPHSVSANVLLDAITVVDGQVWVAGEADSPSGGGRPLVEHYVDGTWHVASLPAVPGHSNWANLYGITFADGAIWTAGTYVDPATDNNNALVLEYAHGKWTISHAPNPGSGSNIPGGIATVDGQLWLAGMYDDGNQEIPLVEHRS